MRRFSIVVCLALMAAAVAGCSGQKCVELPCSFQPAVTLTVVDAVDGGPVGNPIANGLTSGTSGVCLPMKADGGSIGTGTSSIGVTAASHVHMALDLTVPSASADPCSCQPDHVPQNRTVALPPL